MRKNSEEKQGDKVVSPMPGKVMKIPANEGDLLSAGGYRGGARSHEDAEQL